MNISTIHFAGGCFWGVEHFFHQIKGVVSTKTGYANGNIDNPSYEMVYADDTGYAESRRKLCEEAWPCRGKAAENIVDYLTEKRTQLCEARAAAQKTEET